jgi:beta-lactamase regulating signal transducer with metallopeptidase domain
VTAARVAEVLALTVAHGTVLALTAWVLSRTLLRRARPGVIAAVWTVVLVKFVVPFGPAMPYSVSDVIEALRSHDAAAATVPVDVIAQAGPAPAAAATSPWLLAAIVIWLAVALAVGVRAIRRSRAAVRAARALPPASPALVTELALLARRLRAPIPALRVGGAGAAPHVIGLWRPTIVLPETLAAPYRAIDRAAVLSHELAHLRRRDPWIAVVQAAAAALLWFWPVVALVNRRIVAAREAACDAWAVESGPLGREQYARLLLSFARTPAPLAGAALAARAGGLGARIDGVLDRRARAGVGPLGLGVVAVWVVIGLGGARSAEARVGAPVCVFTTEVASTLLAAHPEADLDGDGTLSRAEACELQAELRKRIDEGALVVAASPVDDTVPVSAEDAAVRAALAEPICCNCQGGEGMSSPSFTPVVRDQACVVEGDSP